MSKRATILFAVFFAMFLSLPKASSASQNNSSNFVPINWYAHAESTSALKQKVNLNIVNESFERALKTIS